MFIIDMTHYESDFIAKSTERSGANRVRSYDIDHRLSLFIYFYDDSLALELKRYGEKETTMADWSRIQKLGLLFQDIDLRTPIRVWKNEKDNKLHIHLPNVIRNRKE